MTFFYRYMAKNTRIHVKNIGSNYSRMHQNVYIILIMNKES